jgi:hypothetical protein
VKTVIIESPFAGPDEAAVLRNIRYARACMRFCLVQGVAPYASHVLYTQPGVFDDDDPRERQLGIDAGQAIGDRMDETWVFLDLGVSRGMGYGIQRAKDKDRPIREFTLGPDWGTVWLGPTADRSF